MLERRVAVVALDGDARDFDRIERAAAQAARIVVVCPPDRREHLGRFSQDACWAPPDAEIAAPVPALAPSVTACRALCRLAQEGTLEEARFAGRHAAGWASALESRQGSPLGQTRITIEVEQGDERLAAPLSLGQGVADVLYRDAARQSFRDADAVEGDRTALSMLRSAGWTLSTPRSPEQPIGVAPRVSAVVTHKDLEAYLPECLESLRRQTLPVEIILVDDGSAASGLASVDSQVARDPAMRVIRQSNSGLGAARNAGIRAASGDFVLIVDADNVLRSRCAEVLVEALRHRPDASFAAPAFRAFQDGSGILDHYYCPSELSPATLFLDNTAGDACALHRKEHILAVDGFSTDRSGIEDLDLWLRYAEANRHGAVVPEVLFDYRVRSDSMLRSQEPMRRVFHPYRLALAHRRLLARWEEEVALLAAERDARWLALSEARAAQLEAAARTAAQQEAAARMTEEQLSRALREAELREAAASARAERAGARATESALQAERAGARATESALQAERAAAETAEVRRALDEMASSSAVRLARYLRRSSPVLHRLVGAASRKTLKLLGRD